jgi:hypothetical protein
MTTAAANNASASSTQVWPKSQAALSRTSQVPTPSVAIVAGASTAGPIVRRLPTNCARACPSSLRRVATASAARTTPPPSHTIAAMM